VPGSLLVVALVIVGLVVAGLVVVLRPQSVLGPPLLLVTAEDAITAAPDSTTVPGNFGPHCTPFRWLDRQSALSVEADQDLSGVEGLLLQHYPLPPTNIQWDGGDAIRPQILVPGRAWEVSSPIDGRVLAAFVRDGANVTVGGTTYGPGATWTMLFEYTVSAPGGVVDIVEDITFRNRGIVATHLVPPRACA